MLGLREHSLGLFFLGIFLATLAGQSFAGQHAYNEEAAQHGEQTISCLESDAAQKVGGRADPDSPAWAKARGWRLHVFSNSLLLAFGLIFLASWVVQSLTGWSEYNDLQEEHRDATVSWVEYVSRPDFWERTLQNRQSEFLAVGTMTVFAIYLRQRGSPESKPVGEPHEASG